MNFVSKATFGSATDVIAFLMAYTATLRNAKLSLPELRAGKCTEAEKNLKRGILRHPAVLIESAVREKITQRLRHDEIYHPHRIDQHRLEVARLAEWSMAQRRA